MQGHEQAAGPGFESWTLQTRAFLTGGSRGFRGRKANPKTCTHKMDKERARAGTWDCTQRRAYGLLNPELVPQVAPWLEKPSPFSPTWKEDGNW